MNLDEKLDGEEGKKEGREGQGENEVNDAVWSRGRKGQNAAWEFNACGRQKNLRSVYRIVIKGDRKTEECCPVFC